MNSEKVRVPTSSLPELKKIIRGYIDLGKDVGLDDLSKRIAMNRTVISPNNPFLTQSGLISGKNRKTPTELGVLLGRAIEHDQAEDIKKYWQQVVSANEFLSGLVSTVRLKNGMTEDELSSHVLYAGGLKKNQKTITGANAVVDILKESELLQLDANSGKLNVAKYSAPKIDERKSELASVSERQHKNEPTADEQQKIVISKQVVASTTPTIAINIELRIPPSENPVVYENLFSALRKHLLEPKGQDDE